jgi:amino acid transporter
MVGAGFSNLAYYFQAYGVLDFLLPFVLAFTIIYAVTGVLPLFKGHKNFRVIIALSTSLIFVVPHIIGTYPLGYDPVQVLNETLPSISLIAISVVMLLILMGLFGAKFSAGAMPVLAAISIGFVVYVFGSSLRWWDGPSTIFSWWSPEVTELMVILLVFGSVVYFIVKEPGSGDAGKKIWGGFRDLFDKI